MAEGNPVRALERGERVEMPPGIVIQGTNDAAHPRPNLDRFVELYRKAGGHVEVELLEGQSEGFMTRDPNSPASRQAIEKIVEFVHKQLG